MIAIFDLDGTLALNEHRQHFLKVKPKNWKAFEAACVDDKPNMNIIKIVQLFDDQEIDIHILSGRSELVRYQSCEWLRKYSVPYKIVMMRNLKDYRGDEIVKWELFEQLRLKIGCSVFNSDFIIFDDRQKVVNMWREKGLTCCQVAPGNF